MLENFKKVDNPLTVIAIFAGVAEVSMSAVAILNSDLRATFIWFVMLFPVLLILLFFYTLNTNHKVLYAPSDFRDDKAFVDLASPSAKASLELGEAVEQLEQLEVGVDGETAIEVHQILQRINRAKDAMDTLTEDGRLLASLTFPQMEILEALQKRKTMKPDEIIMLPSPVSSLTSGLQDLLGRQLVQYSPDGMSYVLSEKGLAFMTRLLSGDFDPIR